MHLMGGANAVKKLSNLGPYRLGIDFSAENIIETISAFEFQKLADDLASIDGVADEAAKIALAQKALRRVVAQLDHPNINPTKGSLAHLLLIQDLLLTPGVKIRGIEFDLDPVEIGTNGDVLPVRRIDIQIEVDGKIIDVEVKNFQSHTWRSNLQRMMSFKKGDNAAEGVKAGQLFNDIVGFVQNGNQGKRYVFMPDIEASVDDIYDHIEELLYDSENRQNLVRALSLDDDLIRNDESWEAYVDALMDSMTVNEFMTISNLDNVVGR